MVYYDEQLRKLREQLAEKEHLEAVKREKKEQRWKLDARVNELSEQLKKEEADVSRLEGRSLTALFHQIVGNRDEKLDKERREACEAKVRYDAALRELQALNADILRCDEALRGLSDCQRQYTQLLKEKNAAIRAAGGETAAEIERLESASVALIVQKREVEEALTAAQSALRLTKGVLDSLDDAEGYGVWDMVGGGLIADVAKHSALDSAQEQVEDMQIALSRLRTELTDVRIKADLQISLDGFTRFADHFFDGIIMDWTVMDKINQSQSAVRNLQSQLDTLVVRLKQMLSGLDWELKQNTQKINDLVENTVL